VALKESLSAAVTNFLTDPNAQKAVREMVYLIV